MPSNYVRCLHHSTSCGAGPDMPTAMNASPCTLPANRDTGINPRPYRANRAMNSGFVRPVAENGLFRGKYGYISIRNGALGCRMLQDRHHSRSDRAVRHDLCWIIQ